MIRTQLTLAAGVGVGVGSLTAARHDQKDDPKQAVLSTKDIAETLDRKEAKPTTVELTLEPGQSSADAANSSQLRCDGRRSPRLTVQLLLDAPHLGSEQTSKQLGRPWKIRSISSMLRTWERWATCLVSPSAQRAMRWLWMSCPT